MAVIKSRKNAKQNSRGQSARLAGYWNQIVQEAPKVPKRKLADSTELSLAFIKITWERYII
jgi:hypothetical protein